MNPLLKFKCRVQFNQVYNWGIVFSLRTAGEFPIGVCQNFAWGFTTSPQGVDFSHFAATISEVLPRGNYNQEVDTRCCE